MSNSESESDREGEQFFYDDDDVVVYPRRVRRKSKTSLHVMTINNAHYKSMQDNTALRIGFDAFKETARKESFCDYCFHGMVSCSMIAFAVFIGNRLS